MTIISSSSINHKMQNFSNLNVLFKNHKNVIFKFHFSISTNYSSRNRVKWNLLKKSGNVKLLMPTGIFKCEQINKTEINIMHLKIMYIFTPQGSLRVWWHLQNENFPPAQIKKWSLKILRHWCLCKCLTFNRKVNCWQKKFEHLPAS